MAELFSDSTYSSSSSRCSSPEIRMQNHQSIRSSQPTPQGRRGKELHPSKLISSDSVMKMLENQKDKDSTVFVIKKSHLALEISRKY